MLLGGYGLYLQDGMVNDLIKRFFVIISILFIITSCKFFTYSSEAVQIQVKSTDFTIAWDSSDYIVIGSAAINSYRIYYRNHGENRWKFLDEIANIGNCEYKIMNSVLDYGIYDFAVSSVNKEGAESDLHTSLDTTADPVTGWYINWIGSK